MLVNELQLEMTRNCTLCCEHCLRGDKECVNIDMTVIDKIFDEVTYVRTLLLTGGEPLIAVRELEYLIEVIKNKNIQIDRIGLVTNGTIMSARVLRILKELSKIAFFKISVSNDIFHKLELDRLGLSDLRDKNFRILKDLFGAQEFGNDFGTSRDVYLSYCGRCECLTKERLAEINSIANSRFVLEEGVRTMRQPRTFIDYNAVYGFIPVDIYGNIVSYGQSFLEEDKEAEEIKINVKDMGFKKAVRAFCDYLGEKELLAAVPTFK